MHAGSYLWEVCTPPLCSFFCTHHLPSSTASDRIHQPWFCLIVCSKSATLHLYALALVTPFPCGGSVCIKPGAKSSFMYPPSEFNASPNPDCPRKSGVSGKTTCYLAAFWHLAHLKLAVSHNCGFWSRLLKLKM